MTDNNHPGYTDPLPWHLFCDEGKLTDEELAVDTAWDAHCARHLKRERELSSMLETVANQLTASDSALTAAVRIAGELRQEKDDALAEVERLKAQYEGMKGERDGERQIAVDWEKKAEGIVLQIQVIDRAWRDVLAAIPIGTLPPGLIHVLSDALAGMYVGKPVAVNRVCAHNWVDAKNEVVTSGKVCLKCGSIDEVAPMTEAKMNEISAWGKEGAEKRKGD